MDRLFELQDRLRQGVASRHAFRSSVWSEVASGAAGRVAVLAKAPASGLERTLSRRTEIESATLLTSARAWKGWLRVANDEDLHQHLLAAGPLDTILAEVGFLAQPEQLRACMYYLRPSGKFVLVGDTSSPCGQNGERALDSLFGDRAGESVGAFSSAIAELNSDAARLMVTKVGEHWVPIAEDQFTPECAERHGWAWVGVEEIAPAEPFHIQSVATMNMAQHKGRFRRRGTLPALRVRTYTGATVYPRQVVTAGSVLLPESFRQYRAPNVGSGQVERVTGRFMKMKGQYEPAEPLDGVYLHLDTEFPQIYGHLVTEVISRLWAWDQLKDRYPNLRALVSLADGRDRIPNWFTETLMAFGIAAEDIVPFDRPMKVERLIGATPLFSNPYVAHPRLRSVWERTGDGLIRQSDSDVGTPSRIFVSRKAALTRRCHQEADLLGLFKESGFEIFYPEDHDLATQALTFRNAEVIAGYGGSGMLNAIYGRPGQTCIVITSDMYNAMNEYLISSVFGNPVHYFYGNADISHPAHGWSVRAFKSDFTFDLDRRGAGLVELLDRL